MNDNSNPEIIHLQQFSLLRPEKIAWHFPYQGGDPLTYFKSETTVAFLQDAEAKLAEFGITWEIRSLSREGFTEWLSFYQKIVAEHQYEALASWEWFERKVAQGLVIEELVFRQQGEVVGSELFYCTPEKATACFKASHKIEKLSKKRNSLGVIIDYFFILTAIKRNVSTISFGRSRNAFGVINPLGNLDYKLRCGMLPFLPENSTMLESVPINAEGVVAFFAVKNADDHLSLYGLTPEGQSYEFNLERFRSEKLQYRELTYKN